MAARAPVASARSKPGRQTGHVSFIDSESGQRLLQAVLPAYKGADGYERGDEIHGYCPWCSSPAPSESSLNVKDGTFHCFGCNASSGLKELAAKLGIGTDAAEARPTEGSTASAAAAPMPRCTDMGNGRRFALQHANKVRYVNAWGWMVWDGRRWAMDDAGGVMRLARLTVRTIYQEAAQEPDEEERKRLARWGERSENLRVRLSMLESAQSEEGIPARPPDFDRDPWLFNCWNGTLDLRTGELKAHDPQDMITRISPVTYIAGASSTVWDDFLRKATQGNTELSDYLRRASGYSLTGLTLEEVFWFLLGPEATGKTTYSESLRGVLGDYAVKASFDTFLEQRTGGARSDIAGLAGARLVTAVEANATKRMAEPLIKELVGGDTISARHLYHESFSFKPQCKLILAANASPKISDDDGAIWRRLRRLPFEQVIPEDERDPEVKAFLTDPERGGPAVLAWAVQGCLEWQKARLGYPSCIREKTRELRESMDPLKDFIAERCVLGADKWVVTGALRAAYERWASDRGEKPTIQGREWGRRLRAKGAEPKQRKNPHTGIPERGWTGVELAPVPDSEEVPEVPPDSISQLVSPLMGGVTHPAGTSGTSGTSGPNGNGALPNTYTGAATWLECGLPVTVVGLADPVAGKRFFRVAETQAAISEDDLSVMEDA